MTQSCAYLSKFENQSKVYNSVISHISLKCGSRTALSNIRSTTPTSKSTLLYIYIIHFILSIILNIKYNCFIYPSMPTSRIALLNDSNFSSVSLFNKPCAYYSENSHQQKNTITLCVFLFLPWRCEERFLLWLNRALKVAPTHSRLHNRSISWLLYFLKNCVLSFYKPGLRTGVFGR